MSLDNLSIEEIGIGQVRVKTGDINGNLFRCTKAIYDLAFLDRIKLVILPELCLPGYNCGYLFELPDFQQQCKEAEDQLLAIAKQCGVSVIFGNITKTPDHLFNSGVYCDANGEVHRRQHKTHLANFAHHDDSHYFTPNNKPIESIGNSALLICEDIWQDQVKQLKQTNPDLSTVYCINFSYFYPGKRQERVELLKKIAREEQVRICYVNAVGVGDITKNVMVYDGSSFFVEPDGNALCAKFLDEDIVKVSDMQPFKALDSTKERYDATVFGTRCWYEELGITKIQVHVSGGIDSAVGAVIAHDTGMPVDLLTQPSRDNSNATIDNAFSIAKAMGLPLHWQIIDAVVDSVEHSLSDANDGVKINSYVKGTIQAVARSLYGRAWNNMRGAGTLACGNQTENMRGWFTAGDPGSLGILQPMGDWTKEEVFEVAMYLSKDRQIIPWNLLDGTIKPAAELADANEDPFDYSIWTPLLASFIREEQTPQSLLEYYKKLIQCKFLRMELPSDTPEYARKFCTSYRHYFTVACHEKIHEKEDELLYVSQLLAEAWKLYIKSAGKIACAAPILIMSPRTRGFSAREPIVNHWLPEAK